MRPPRLTEPEFERWQHVRRKLGWVVASLFQSGKAFHAASVLAKHRSRLVEPPQQTISGLSAQPVQLTMPCLGGGSAPSEFASLDEAQLAPILDDLVASGDLQVSGHGKKKRFQLVPRGVSS